MQSLVDGVPCSKWNEVEKEKWSFCRTLRETKDKHKEEETMDAETELKAEEKYTTILSDCSFMTGV